jgi:hypothetical protein
MRKAVSMFWLPEVTTVCVPVFGVSRSTPAESGAVAPVVSKKSTWPLLTPFEPG